MSGLAPNLSLRSRPLTNGAEVSAYIVAQAITLAAEYATAPFYTRALYRWAFQTGSANRSLLMTVEMAISVLWAAVGFGLFLLLREAFVGVPAMIRGPGGTRSTAGFEIGAYILAQFLGMATSMAVYAALASELYARIDPIANRIHGHLFCDARVVRHHDRCHCNRVRRVHPYASGILQGATTRVARTSEARSATLAPRYETAFISHSRNLAIFGTSAVSSGATT
jgi:hypothetical protein